MIWRILFFFLLFSISYDRAIFVNLYDRIVWKIRPPVRIRKNIGFYTYIQINI